MNERHKREWQLAVRSMRQCIDQHNKTQEDYNIPNFIYSTFSSEYTEYYKDKEFNASVVQNICNNLPNIASCTSFLTSISSLDITFSCEVVLALLVRMKTLAEQENIDQSFIDQQVKRYLLNRLHTQLPQKQQLTNFLNTHKDFEHKITQHFPHLLLLNNRTNTRSKSGNTTSRKPGSNRSTNHFQNRTSAIKAYKHAGNNLTKISRLTAEFVTTQLFKKTIAISVEKIKQFIKAVDMNLSAQDCFLNKIELHLTLELKNLTKMLTNRSAGN